MAGDRTVKVTLKGDISDFNRALLSASAGAKAFSKELDSSTDRATNLTQSVLALGPALVPISTIAVPAIAGLTNQLAFAATGAGVTALAFSGIGDALKATNDYAIKPTEAHLAKLEQTLAALGPAGRDFVNFLQELRPRLQVLQSLAQEGMFPGMESGIRDLMGLMPEAEQIVFTVSSTIGDLIAEAGHNLNDPRWADFFTFLETEARPTLLNMGHTVGNLAEGFANLWMAFDPLSDDFSNAFLKLSRDFAAWTDGLDQTEGFQEFIAYIQENGPKAWDTLAAVGDALLQIVEAAAPVGAATLPVITALAKVIGTIADSDLGPVVIGVISLTSALSRLKAIGTAANSSAIGGLFGGSAMGGGLSKIKTATAAAEELRVAQSKLADNPGMQGLTVYKSNLQGVAEAEKKLGAATKARNAQFRAGAVGVGTMAFVMSGLDDKLHLTNTAMLAMAGSMAGPWGAGLGAGVGLVMDLASAGDSAAEKIRNLTAQVNAAGALSGQERHDISVTGSSLVDDQDSLKASEALDAALESNRRKAEDAKFAEAGLSNAMRDTSQATRDQTLALLDNIAKHNERANALLGDRGAMRNIEAAMDAATASVKENGRTLDLNTQKGRNNQAALDAIASSYNTLSDGAKQNEGTQKRVRNAIIEAGISMGLSAGEARKLARDLMDIPSPNVGVNLDLSKAYTQISALKRYLKGIKDEDVIINVRRAIESGGGRGHQLAASANGNIFDYYANGGLRENHIAQIAAANTVRVWAEPETGGESYIPLAPSKRERSLDIWAETGKRLGVRGFADGALVRRMGSGAGSAGGTTVTVQPMAGMQAKLVGPNLIEVIDGRVEVIVSQNNNYRGN